MIFILGLKGSGLIRLRDLQLFFFYLASFCSSFIHFKDVA